MSFHALASSCCLRDSPNSPVQRDTSPRAIALSWGSTHLRVSNMDPTSVVEWTRTKKEKMMMYHIKFPHSSPQFPLTAETFGPRHLQSENSYWETGKMQLESQTSWVSSPSPVTNSSFNSPLDSQSSPSNSQRCREKGMLCLLMYKWVRIHQPDRNIGYHMWHEY